MAEILDGKALAVAIRQEIGSSVLELLETAEIRPRLDAILVGDNPASQIYVRNKMAACKEVGISSESHLLPENTAERELLDLIHQLNSSPDVHGILLQLPLPPQIDKVRALDAISPAKDVDGLHPLNVGLLVQNRASLVACTPLGVIEVLRRHNVALSGKNAAVVGRSDLVGKPLSLLLMHANATVTVCHSRTQNLKSLTSGADILIAAIGKPGFVTSEMIREGAIVIDVGINVIRSEEEVIHFFGPGSKKLYDFRNGKTVMVGDVHPQAYEKSSLYTPVPGGVGPLTIAMLLNNTVTAARLSVSSKARR